MPVGIPPSQYVVGRPVYPQAGPSISPLNPQKPPTMCGKPLARLPTLL